MKELYYKPSEYEYCIGFEYQTLSDPRFPEKDSSWSNVKINSLKDLEDICHYLIVDDFIEHRVKYLDKDDIENLGFKKSLRNQCIGWDDYYFGKTINPEYDYFLYLTLHVPSQRFNSNFIRDNQFKLIVHRYYISDSYETTHIESNINSGDSEIIYKGLIRNISELKKILIQTGVL